MAGTLRVAVVNKSGFRGSVGAGPTTTGSDGAGLFGAGTVLVIMTTCSMGAGDTGLSVGAKDGIGPGVGMAVGGG